MLYKKNSAHELSEELFLNPTCEYRGTPFWAWNCDLDEEELLRQIECLKKMGFGGFHMHTRSGMSTKYLSDEFFRLIKSCTSKAKNENMLAWLYDEDRWSSGSAGGMVTKKDANRQKILVFTKNKLDSEPVETAFKNEKAVFMCAYDITLSSAGKLVASRVIGEDDLGENKWYAYIRCSEKTGWYNNESYVDTLSIDAMNDFLDITHKAYFREVGNEFGKTVPAIFTDEPQFAGKTCLKFSADTHDLTIPWTLGFEDYCMKKCGLDILAQLPEIFWDLENNTPSKIRYFYHECICERFTEAFADNLGKWCAEHNIYLTGHMLCEPGLDSQTICLGEAMRAYRSFGIPGIDMLCNDIELSTAKQAQSSVHQYGKEAMLSELYGVTNWDFDFRGHKFQGDWQAALGVTVRVPHLSWVSMKGSAKRDYPASINYQSPWFMEYSYVEDHFARLNTALTRGQAVVRVGVIHPIESYWINYGPNETSEQVKKQTENNFQEIIKWLLFGLIDFDFICESQLPLQYSKSDEGINVGVMNYSTIIVPNCITLRKTTLDILNEFKQKGGNVVFVGAMPKYIDLEEDSSIKELYSSAVHAQSDSVSVLESIECERLLDIKNDKGRRTTNLIYSLRKDNDCSWLFIAHGKEPELKDYKDGQNIKITIFGKYTPVVYDTISGSILEIAYSFNGNNTELSYELYQYDSLLIKLLPPTECSAVESKKEVAFDKAIDIKEKVSYTREEPNVLVLDMAEYALNDGEYNDLEELLRIDLALRNLLDYPKADGTDIQPWAIEKEKITNFVKLKFKVYSDIEVPVTLAYEELEALELNGDKVTINENGYYVDKAIKTTKLGALKTGENEIIATVPISKRISIENMFLLGEFNALVTGAKAKIVAPSNEIAFGDITSQGLPFYGGNITYKFEIDVPNSKLTMDLTKYRGALVKVSMDGKNLGKIVYPPYELKLSNVSQGTHTFELKLFGNRVNTFGALHNCSRDSWVGPDYWYSRDDKWSYEYVLKKTGILSSPVFRLTTIK